MSGDPVDLEAVVRKLHSDVAEILGVVMPMMRDVALFGQKADRTGAAIGRLEDGQKSLRAELLAELSETSVAVGRLDEGQTKLRVDLMERMDRLQHRLDSLNEHLTMGLGHSDRVEQKSDGVAEQNRLLAEQMKTMHTLLRRLEGRVNNIEDRLK
jgi:hypothetical protein